MNIIALVSLCFGAIAALLIGKEEYAAKPIDKERFRLEFLLAHQNVTTKKTTYGKIVRV